MSTGRKTSPIKQKKDDRYHQIYLWFWQQWNERVLLKIRD